MKRTAALALTIGAMIAASPALSFAQDAESPPEVDNQRRGKQLYELGKKLFAAKEFLEAAKTFAESFAFDPRPGALFNQGRCLEEGGDRDAAISAYKRYVALEADGDAADEARTRTLALERLIEIDRDKRAGDDKSTVVGPHHDGSAGQSLRWTGLATGGVGVVVFATGVVFGLKAKSISSEIEGRDRGQWTDAEIDRFNEGERAEVVGISLMAVGTAAVIGGGVLYYLGHRAKRDVEIAPAITSDGAGAQVTVRF